MEYPSENTIATATCWELLRDASFGRVALSIDALPMILPVEYSLDGEDIAVCLGQYRLDARTVNNAVVGFAADAIDSTARTGWTVHVQGVAHLHPQAGVAADCGQPDPGQIVHITPETISGQHFQLCPFGTGLPALGPSRP
jgi:Pyridoxamine 5'-phosphate oxidase